MGLSSVNDNTIQILITELYYADHDEDVTGDSHNERAFAGGPTTSQQIWGGVADGGHIEFLKMLISPYWMKTFAQNLV